MYIYVIELLIETEIMISHIFLTRDKAYGKFVDLIDKYYTSDSVEKMWLIERDICDETGLFYDRIIDKMDSKVSADKNSEDVHLQEWLGVSMVMDNYGQRWHDNSNHVSVFEL